MDTKVKRQSSDGSDQLASGGSDSGDSVRVVAMCTFDAVQDYELGFRQYDVLTAIAKAEEDPSWWVGQIGGKVGLFPSECVEIIKGYTDRLPLFKIFLTDDADGNGGLEGLISNEDVPVPAKHHRYISPSASTSSLVSSSSSTELDITRQRASTHPADADVAVVSCYRCNTEVSIKKGQSFYPCDCGANVKRPDDDDHQEDQQDSDARNNANAKRRRSNTAGAAVAGGVVRETAKQRKKREKREREQKKKQEEEERKFRERRDKGRVSASQWNRQVDSARERLWRASVIVAGPNGEFTDDGSTSILSTDDDVSTVGSSAYDVDTFEDARSDSPRDMSSFSSALSGRSLSRTGSLSNISWSESSKVKRDKKTTKTMTKEQRKKEKEEKKRLKKLEKEEREEKRKMERMGKEKKRRNSLFSSSGSIATRKQRDKLTSSSSATGNGNPDSITVTINPITAHAKKQQQQMKSKTMVKTKSGKIMTLEEVEREGKKTNWDVSRLFSVRMGGGRIHKQQVQRKASLGAPDASSHVIQRAAQQERELQEAARQLEEERRRFAEERQRFEAERLKVMLMLAQDMEGVKIAREGTPMYPSPANHPLLVPTEPSPIPSFAASQSSFTCLPSITTLSADALVSEYHAPALPSVATVPLSMAPPTSNSTPSLPSVAGDMYNPSLTLMPTTISLAPVPEATTAEPTSESSVEEATEASVPSSPRKPPSGGVFLPFLVAPRGAGSQQRAVVEPSLQREADAAAELDEKLLDQLKDANADDDAENSDDEHGEEEEERSDNDEDDDDAAITTSEEEVRTKPVTMKERRKITVAPIQGIPDMRELDAKQQLDGSWITAISPRQRNREECEQQSKADDSDDVKDVIVRPDMSPSSVVDKSKKVSFSGASWTSAESPRRILEALRAQGASQAEIDRERKRLDSAADTASDLEATKAAIATKYEAEIDQLLNKMNQLRERSSSDDSWGSSSDVSDVDDDTKQMQPHDISSDEEDDGDDSDEENEEEVVIPEWNRGPPKSLKEMKEYKEFVRARYEAEKRETERMLRRNQREMRSRGMTDIATSTPYSASSSPLDQRVSWII